MIYGQCMETMQTAQHLRQSAVTTSQPWLVEAALWLKWQHLGTASSSSQCAAWHPIAAMAPCGPGSSIVMSKYVKNTSKYVKYVNMLDVLSCFIAKLELTRIHS